jgi:hypothetical protein
MDATRKPSLPAVPKKPLPETAFNPEAIQALRRSSCPTLSGKSTLHYDLGLDAEQTPLIRITACTGGGFFSKEWVRLPAIRLALQKSKAVTAILLFPLFKGKSVNTPGYLLAVLRAEKLIQPLPGKTRVHELCPDWDARVASIVQGGSGTGKPSASKPKPASKTKPVSKAKQTSTRSSPASTKKPTR